MSVKNSLPELDVLDKLLDFFKTFGSLSTTTVKKTTSTSNVRISGSPSRLLYHSTIESSGMTLFVDLAGIDPQTVSLTVGGNQAIVTGKRGDKRFTNRFTIMDEFDVTTATARLVHGRLEVHMDGRPMVKPTFRNVTIELK